MTRIALSQIEVMKKVAEEFDLKDYRYYHRITESIFDEMYESFRKRRDDVTVIEFMWIFICYFRTLRRPDHQRERSVVMTWGSELMKKDYNTDYKYY